MPQNAADSWLQFCLPAGLPHTVAGLEGRQPLQGGEGVNNCEVDCTAECRREGE